MSKPPPKKIVSTKQYLILTGKRLWLYADSLLSAGAAVVLLAYAIRSLVHWTGIDALHDSRWMEEADAGLRHTFLGLSLSAIAVRASNRARLRARSIESVQPLTNSNVHLLPLEDTLVRSSDVPMAEQQAVLLRAVSQEQQTPSTQLLRAGQKEPE